MDGMLMMIASVSLGICVGILVWLFLYAFSRIEVERGLEQEMTARLPLLIRIFLPFVPNTRFVARNKSLESMVRQADESLTMAGFSQQLSGEDFVAVRVLMFFLGLLLMFLSFFGGHALAGMALWVMFVLYPGLWLRGAVRKRHMDIMRALPNVLDLLSLSVEAGKDFLNSLRDILARRQTDALGEELGRTLKEIQLGKKRVVALRDLVNRVRQSDLTSVMNAIIQADELGVSVGNLLRIQSDLLRNKRFTRAEKLAGEAPVKMLFPMVLFIFPAVMVILLTPILMQALEMF
jgi:tight adherence protein C